MFSCKALCRNDKKIQCRRIFGLFLLSSSLEALIKNGNDFSIFIVLIRLKDFFIFINGNNSIDTKLIKI